MKTGTLVDFLHVQYNTQIQCLTGATVNMYDEKNIFKLHAPPHYFIMMYTGPVNSVKKSAKSKNTVGGGELARFPPAIVPIPVRTCKIGQKKFIFKNCSGGTQPVLSSIVKRPHHYLEEFGRDSPATCRPREGIFMISIMIQSSRYQRRQRIATSRYRYDLNRDPPAIHC